MTKKNWWIVMGEDYITTLHHNGAENDGGGY